MSLRSLLGTELPIIQAPMAGVQGSELAVAVSQAGALGSLPCAMLGLDAMREELAAIRARTTGPFNVNFFCHTPPAPDAGREAAWRAALAPYYEELGLDRDAVLRARRARPFSPEAADVLEEFRPAVVSFHFGLPSPELLARVRGWGSKVLSTATTVEEARWLEARGVDAIIAQGLEAGGHRGMFLSDDLDTQLGTLALRAPGRRRREGPGDRHGRHRRREGGAGRVGARCRGRPGRDRVFALPGVHDERRAPRRAEG